MDAAFERQRKFVAIERRNQGIGLPFDNTYLKSAADEIDRLQKKLSKLKGGTVPGAVTKPKSTEDPEDPKGSKSGPRDLTPPSYGQSWRLKRHCWTLRSNVLVYAE